MWTSSVLATVWRDSCKKTDESTGKLVCPYVRLTLTRYIKAELCDNSNLNDVEKWYEFIAKISVAKLREPLAESLRTNYHTLASFSEMTIPNPFLSPPSSSSSPCFMSTKLLIKLFTTPDAFAFSPTMHACGGGTEMYLDPPPSGAGTGGGPVRRPSGTVGSRLNSRSTAGRNYTVTILCR